MTELNAAMRELGEGKYLAGLDRLAAGARNPEFGPGNPLADLWGQMHAIVGGVVDMSHFPAETPPPLAQDLAGQLARAEAHDALAEIVRRARDTRIVILNEAHHSPRDRAFAFEVARALKPLGYTILAAEAFSNSANGPDNEPQIEAMAADGFPRVKHGMYLKDPVFGDFVRRAMALGYRPLSYEMAFDRDAPRPTNMIAYREQTQADNLMKRIFSRDPNARVLIYVGYSHAAEEPLGQSRTPWMAARLKAATGIDPLTIDQATVSEWSGSAEERQLYGALRGRVGSRPVFFTVDGQPLKLGIHGRATDLQVVHPPLALVHGRPNWLLAIGRRPVPVPEHLLPRSGRRLIHAFLANEPADAIPLDQVMAVAGQPAPWLMLPPDRQVRFAVQDPAG